MSAGHHRSGEDKILSLPLGTTRSYTWLRLRQLETSFWDLETVGIAYPSSGILTSALFLILHSLELTWILPVSRLVLHLLVSSASPFIPLTGVSLLGLP